MSFILPAEKSKFEKLAVPGAEGLASIAELVGDFEKRRRFKNQIEGLVGEDQASNFAALADPSTRQQFQKVALESAAKRQQSNQVKELLINQGIDPETAELYALATTGGQTEILKNTLDLKKRGLDKSEPQSQDAGLTPAERVKRENERYSKSLGDYTDLRKRMHVQKEEAADIKALNSLNERDELPKGFQRLNVDKTGKLRLPFAASADAQDYVKRVNRFINRAKDTFGSRVTNFDLEQFMAQLPTLLNDKEARRRVLRRMEITNELNSLYDQALNTVIKEAGGIRKIDWDMAQDQAEERVLQQAEALLQEAAQVDENLMDFSMKSQSKNKKEAKQSLDEILWGE